MNKKNNDSKEKKKVVVSSKINKSKVGISPEDPILNSITSLFDNSLKKEFMEFIEKKSLKNFSKDDEDLRESGIKEKIAFKELTTYGNPLLSLSLFSKISTYNPETIDVDTFTLMRRDQQLSFGLNFIKLPIISLPFNIICEDEKIRKTIEWAFKKIWRSLIKSSLMAIDYGFCTHEKVWKREKIKVAEKDKAGKETVYFEGDFAFYKKIKPHHPGSIKMSLDDKQNVKEIIQESIFGAEEVTLPIRKVFLFTNNKEFGNPFGVSRLKEAYKPWYWKELLYQFMMQYFERRVTPPTIATTPPGKTIDSSGAEVDNLVLGLRLASSLISSSVAAIPYQESRSGRENMWDLKILQDDARGPMFIEALKHLDARCLRALLVPEGIISSDEGGGYAGASVFADLFLMSEQGIISDLEESITEQLIEPMVEANYPPENRPACSVKIDPLDWNRKIMLKEVFVEVLRNLDTMVQMGVPPISVPDVEKLAEILQIPMGSWKDLTGRDPEESVPGLDPESMKTKNEGINKEKDPEKASKKDSKTKVPGRKHTRGQSTNQTQDRKRINPGGRRADRNRETDPSKKR